MSLIVTSNSGTSTTPNAPVPSNAAANTVMWLTLQTFNATDSDATISAAAPSGFEFVFSAGTSTQGVRGRLLHFWKRCTAADSGSYTFGTLTSAAYEMTVGGLTNAVKVGKPWNALYASNTGASSTATTQSNTGITPGSASATVLGSASNSTGGNWTPPTGFTEDYDAGAKLETFHLTTGSAAATGSYTTTCSGAGYMRAGIIAIAADDHVDTRDVGNYVFAATTAQTPALPTHEPGDRITIVVSGKSETTSAFTISSGWTLVGSGTGGTGTAGADTGQMFWSVWQRDVVAGESSSGGTPISNPTITPGATAPNTWMGEISVASPSTGKAWRDTIAASADYVKAISDTDTVTSVTGGTASAMTNQPTTGDAVHVFGCFPTDAMTTCTALVASATGLSDGTVAGLPTAVNSSTPQTTQSVSVFNRNSLGNDCAMAFFDWVEFNGTASSGITASFTHNATNQSGVVIVVAHRQIAGPTVVTVGQATETDTGLTVAAVKVGAVITAGLSSETDTALTLAAVKVGVVVVVGQATETDTALAASVETITPITLTPGLPVETDSALAAATHVKVVVGLTTETDTALAASTTAGARVSVGLATETDTAFGVTVAQLVTVGQAAETDTALAATVDNAAPSGTIVVGIAVETDQALRVTVVLGYTGTELDNRSGGRVRSGLGVPLFDPPLADLPATLAQGVSYPTAQAFGPVTMVGTQPHFEVSTARGANVRLQILFGNRDITFERDVPTPRPDWQTAQPFMYGPSTIRLPQFAHPHETAGVGYWSWLKPGRPVRYRIIDVTSGDVLKTVYRGVSTGFDTDGGTLTVQVAGQATGRMALRDQQGPLFSSKQNPKKLIARVFESIGVPFDRDGSQPNFELGRFGDTGMLDYAQQILARSWNSSGRQWTVMPNESGVYEMALRDNTTVHGTIYLDDARTSPSLHRDISEEPNRIFGRGTTPEGRRVHNGVYPGLVKIDPVPPYPYNDGRTFGLGTMSDDTDHGFAAMLSRLQTFGYLSRDDADDADGEFTQDVADAVAEVQDEAGLLPVNGLMYEATWDALFNVGVTGFSVWWSKIEPMASLRSTRRWKRTPDGAILEPNPDYDPKRLKVDRTLDFGAGFEVRQMRNFAKRELDAANDPNWVGEITLNLGAIVRGDHTWGDPVDPMADWELEPTMNFKVVSSAGGELMVGCSGVTFSDGPTRLSVDTRNRDAMPLYEVLRRNKESRGDLNRRAKNQSRASTEVKDVITEFEEYGGRIDAVPVPGGAWKVFPVVAGKAGQVERIRIRTRGAVGDAESDVAAPTRFVLAVFGKQIDASFLASQVPNPLDDKSGWYDEDFRKRLEDDYLLAYIVGEPGALGGYWPHVQGDGNPITGIWDDRAGFSFRTGAKPVLYVAYHGEDDSIIAGGRIMWNQEIVGS